MILIDLVRMMTRWRSLVGTGCSQSNANALDLALVVNGLPIVPPGLAIDYLWNEQLKASPLPSGRRGRLRSAAGGSAARTCRSASRPASAPRSRRPQGSREAL